LKLTKRQLSLRLNVSDVTIYLWEKNRVEPSLRLLPKIIKFLGYYPDETSAKSLGEKLRYFRRVQGLSQKKLAQLLKIDESTIGNWEKDENLPLKRNLQKLLDFFDSYPSSSSGLEE